jgi:hypothetical protein
MRQSQLQRDGTLAEEWEGVFESIYDVVPNYILQRKIKINFMKDGTPYMWEGYLKRALTEGTEGYVCFHYRGFQTDTRTEPLIICESKRKGLFDYPSLYPEVKIISNAELQNISTPIIGLHYSGRIAAIPIESGMLMLEVATKGIRGGASDAECLISVIEYDEGSEYVILTGVAYKRNILKEWAYARKYVQIDACYRNYLSDMRRLLAKYCEHR